MRNPKYGLLRSLIAAAALAVALVLMVRWYSHFMGSTVLYDAESEFSRIRVVDDSEGVRSLYTGEGRARQTAIIPGRPRHLVSEYTRVAMIGPALAPTDGRFLFVGLGGGAMPVFTHEILPAAKIEVVELDSMIVDVALRYFEVRPDSNLAVHTGDGRAFIEQAPSGTYDLIVLDAFSDDEIPRALATREFLEATKDALSDGGVVISNLWSSSPTFPEMLATYEAVFNEVHKVRVPGTIQRIIITRRGAPLTRVQLDRAAQRLQNHVDLGFDLPTRIQAGYEGFVEARAPVLYDEHP